VWHEQYKKCFERLLEPVRPLRERSIVQASFVTL